MNDVLVMAWSISAFGWLCLVSGCHSRTISPEVNYLPKFYFGKYVRLMVCLGQKSNN